MKSVIVNVIFAGMWVMMTRAPTLANLLLGYAIGWFIILCFPNLLGSQRYVRRSWGLIVFLFEYLWEFLEANLSVAYLILFVNKQKICPQFFRYDTGDLTPFEVLVLGHCITLTPGTTTVEVDPHYQFLVVHCIHADSIQKVVSGIKNRLEKPLLKVSR